jgi:ribose 5-phosphate isomerase A
MTGQEKLKARAAEYALQFVEDGMVIGLGTGSTVQYFLELLGKKIRGGDLKNIRGIPSSLKTESIAGELKIPLVTFKEYQHLDLSVDGADEVDPALNLIKGGGGALLREKIVAQASERYVIIIDESKYSDKLGSRWSVPVEILPYALPVELKFIAGLGAKVQIRKHPDGRFYQTDQKNYIVDCNFGPIGNAAELAIKLKLRAGIQEHGLFISVTTDVILAKPDSIEHLKRSVSGKPAGERK